MTGTDLTAIAHPTMRRSGIGGCAGERFLAISECRLADRRQTRNHAALRSRDRALKALYAEAGYGIGHRVALLLYNRPDTSCISWR